MFKSIEKNKNKLSSQLIYLEKEYQNWTKVEELVKIKVEIKENKWIKKQFCGREINPLANLNQDKDEKHNIVPEKKRKPLTKLKTLSVIIRGHFTRLSHNYIGKFRKKKNQIIFQEINATRDRKSSSFHGGGKGKTTLLISTPYKNLYTLTVHRGMPWILCSRA